MKLNVRGMLKPKRIGMVLGLALTLFRMLGGSPEAAKAPISSNVHVAETPVQNLDEPPMDYESPSYSAPIAQTQVQARPISHANSYAPPSYHSNSAHSGSSYSNSHARDYRDLDDDDDDDEPYIPPYHPISAPSTYSGAGGSGGSYSSGSYSGGSSGGYSGGSMSSARPATFSPISGSESSEGAEPSPDLASLRDRLRRSMPSYKDHADKDSAADESFPRRRRQPKNESLALEGVTLGKGGWKKMGSLDSQPKPLAELTLKVGTPDSEKPGQSQTQAKTKDPSRFRKHQQAPAQDQGQGQNQAQTSPQAQPQTEAKAAETVKSVWGESASGFLAKFLAEKAKPADPVEGPLNEALRDPSQLLYQDTYFVAFSPKTTTESLEIWIVARNSESKESTSSSEKEQALEQAIQSIERKLDRAWPESGRRFASTIHRDTRIWVQFQEQNTGATPDRAGDLAALKKADATTDAEL